jgi:hypothetical protein
MKINIQNFIYDLSKINFQFGDAISEDITNDLAFVYFYKNQCISTAFNLIIMYNFEKDNEQLINKRSEQFQGKLLLNYFSVFKKFRAETSFFENNTFYNNDSKNIGIRFNEITGNEKPIVLVDFINNLENLEIIGNPSISINILKHFELQNVDLSELKSYTCKNPFGGGNLTVHKNREFTVAYL